MALKNGKSEILSFKVDETLKEAMKGIDNRSDFIRRAVIAALDSTCPLCRGTGVLTPDQRRHWQNFSRNHEVKECDDCHQTYLTCSAGKKTSEKVHSRKRG